MNLALLTDSYKLTHWKQYPPGTQTVYSYFESRGGQFPSTTFFGLQYILKKYFSLPVNVMDVVAAKELTEKHLGPDLFNAQGWLHLLKDHGGWLPLCICAHPEGTNVPVGTPLITVENTCPQCYWLTNYVETLLVQTWYPTTVATVSGAARRLIAGFLEDTGTPADVVYKLHDFGFRGVSSVESAGLGGCAHLVHFRGTDTLPALQVAHKYYQEPCAGHSIPASEHSTITSWGQLRELDAFKNMLDQYPKGLVACVSDSYDIFAACRNWGGALRAQVLARDGCLVIRPDSGDPVEVILTMLDLLSARFPATTNAKGYKVLDSHVRIIQGDGVDLKSIRDILHAMQLHGWSADNIAFGMGGALLQRIDRDTNRFAFKCSAIQINDVWHDVSKSPVTDPSKKSKSGRFDLPCVYQNGVLLREESLATIRGRAS